jgi:hypothetical protein
MMMAKTEITILEIGLDGGEGGYGGRGGGGGWRDGDLGADQLQALPDETTGFIVGGFGCRVSEGTEYRLY